MTERTVESLREDLVFIGAWCRGIAQKAEHQDMPDLAITAPVIAGEIDRALAGRPLSYARPAPTDPDVAELLVWLRERGKLPADEPPPPSPDPRGDGLCPNCPTDLAKLDSGHGVCIECGWTSDPGKCMELYDRIDELKSELHDLRAAPVDKLVAAARSVVDLVDRTVDMPGVVRDVVDNLRDALSEAPADDTAAPSGTSP